MLDIRINTYFLISFVILNAVKNLLLKTNVPGGDSNIATRKRQAGSLHHNLRQAGSLHHNHVSRDFACLSVLFFLIEKELTPQLCPW